LYYSYHVMWGLGTIFIAVMVVAALLLWRGKLYDSRWMLWTLMLCVPAAVHCEHGGMDDGGTGTAALADPWIDAHGAGNLAACGAGNAWFTLIGFMGCIP